MGLQLKICTMEMKVSYYLLANTDLFSWKLTEHLTHQKLAVILQHFNYVKNSIDPKLGCFEDSLFKVYFIKRPNL